MDLGSLELQIFVSLTVVLGGAFVALVCDYLKGNNEQLREHNIELRVRKEEQERRLLLDPAGFFGQWLPGQRNSAARSTTASQSAPRPAAPHEVMQSFAAADALAEAEERAARLHARVSDDGYETADVPPMTQRRSSRGRSNRKPTKETRKNGEKYGDWVRPEVIARVARRAEASVAYSSDIREDLDALPDDVLPEPLNAAENWDIRAQLPAREKPGRGNSSRPSSSNTDKKTSAPAPETQTAVATVALPAASPQPLVVAAEVVREEVTPERLAPEEAERLQFEIERVSQLDRRPLAPAPGTILRPLTVPSLKLATELQRVAEQSVVPVPVVINWNSALLDEVIAASGTRATATVPVVESAVVELEPDPIVLVQEKQAIAAQATPAPVIVEELVAPIPVVAEIDAVVAEETAPAEEIEAEVVEVVAEIPALAELEYTASIESEQPEIAAVLPEIGTPVAETAELSALPELESSAIETETPEINEPTAEVEAEQAEIIAELPVVPELEFASVEAETPEFVAVQPEVNEPTAEVEAEQAEIIAELPVMPELEFASVEAETPEVVAAQPEVNEPTAEVEAEQAEIIAELPVVPELEFASVEAETPEFVAVQPEVNEPTAEVEAEQAEIIAEISAPLTELPLPELAASSELSGELPAFIEPPPFVLTAAEEWSIPEFVGAEEPESNSADPVPVPPFALLSAPSAEISAAEISVAIPAEAVLPELEPVFLSLEMPAAFLPQPRPEVAESSPIEDVALETGLEQLIPSVIEVSEVSVAAESTEAPPVVYMAETESSPAPLALPDTDFSLAESEPEFAGIVEPPPFILDPESEPASIVTVTDSPEWLPAAVEPTEVAETPQVPAEADALHSYYEFAPRPSRLAGMGISASVEYLASVPAVEPPAVRLFLVEEPALTFVASDADEDDLPALSELLSVPSDMLWESLPAIAALPDPPPFWGEVTPKAEVEQKQQIAAPIDISVLRQPEPEVMQPALVAIPDLLLPTGMHDASTWSRLLSLPNPMTGILFIITLQSNEGRVLPPSKGSSQVEDNGPAIEKLMSSFVREGDFGAKTAEGEWVFVYSNDVAGFNQRRVGLISEKLWDFQLRHLGMANVSFKWGAIDVQSEPITAALEAARDRMNQTRRARKLPGADAATPRRVVNG